MPAATTPPRIVFATAGILLAIYLLQGIRACTQKSPAFDETGDIAAGLSYVQDFEVRANLQHPPLMKEMAGAALFAAGVRLGDTPAVRRMLSGGGGEREAGSELLAANGIARPLLVARLPFLLCSTLLGVVLFLWGRELAGDLAALAALLLFTLDPNLMAHGYLVTMDMGLAAFATFFFYSLWRYTRRPDTRRLVVSGLAMGLMLGAKFSAVFLVPVAAALWWLLVPRGGRVRSFLAACGIALVVVQALYLTPGGLYLYTAGLGQVNADHDPNYLVYLGGHLEHRFPTYFLQAWLLKEPLAALLLLAAGLWALRAAGYTTAARLFLLLPVAAILLAHSLFADDLGIRYVLPAMPFTCLIGGIGAAWLISRAAWWGRAAAALLAVWLIAGAAAVYPDQLSYFNEAACLLRQPSWTGLAGGTRCGPLWLDDSNVDWGQGLAQLRQWVDVHAPARPLRLAYFGSFPPANYVPNARPMTDDDLVKPAPGLYAVSAHFVARIPAIAASEGKSDGEWLARTPPIAIAGHAFYLYDIPAAIKP